MRAWVRARDERCGGSIGPQDAHHTLAGNLKRYAHVLGSLGMTRAEAGVTGHGLRAQWAIEFLERRGHVPSVRCGGQASHAPLSPEERLRQQDDRAALARMLGHARVSVVDAYAGALPRARARRATTEPDA